MLTRKNICKALKVSRSSLLIEESAGRLYRYRTIYFKKRRSPKLNLLNHRVIMCGSKKLSSLLSKIEAKIADFVKQTAGYSEQLKGEP
jgi:hypothetical protein